MRKLFIALAVLLVLSNCQATAQSEGKDLLNPNSPTGSSADNATSGSTVDGGTNSSSGSPSGANNTGDTNTTSNDTLTPGTNGTSTSSGINKQAAIIGGSVTAGALVLAGGIAAAVLLAKKYKKNKAKDPRPILAASSKKRKQPKSHVSHVSHNSIESEDLGQPIKPKRIPLKHPFNHANHNANSGGSYAEIARKKIVFKHQQNQRSSYGSNPKDLNQPKQSWANKERKRVMGSVRNKQNEAENHLLRRANTHKGGQQSGLNKRKPFGSFSGQSNDSEIEEGSHRRSQGRSPKGGFSMRGYQINQDQMPPPLPPRLREGDSFAGMNRYYRARI